jgi:thioredoxin-related protein
MIPFLLVATLSLSALQNPLPPPPPKIEEYKLTWFDKGLAAALARAAQERKVVMIYFTGQVCSDCDKLNRETFADERVAELLKDTISVKVDFDKQRDTADRYQVKGPPVIVWLNADGSARDRVNGYQTKVVFLANAARVNADIGTINESRRKIAADGNDLEARFDVYTRLREVGDFKGADEQKAAIQKLDPEGKSRGSHHFRYDAITSAIEQFWAQTHTLDMQKVGELEAFVEAETDPDLLWDGWMRLANTHAYLEGQSSAQGQIEEAAQHRAARRRCLSLAYRGLSPLPDPVHDWGYSVADLFWTQKDELSQADKEFFLKLTARLAKMFDLDGLAFDHHARALFLMGQNREALDALRKAIELDPSNSLFATHMKEFGGG